MTISVTVDALSAHFGGGGTVLLEQLRALHEVAPEIRLTILAAPWNAAALRADRSGTVVEIDVRDGWWRAAWEQLALPRHLDGTDVLYCPGNAVPLRGSPVPTVLALQNPNFFGSGRHAPHNASLGRRARALLARRSARRATTVVTVSHALATDVARDLPEVAPRIRVAQLGRPRLPPPSGPPITLTRPPDRFWLSLANDAAHKHLDTAVLGWVAAHPDATGPVADLVMAGVVSPARRRAQLALVPDSLRPHLHHVGAVADRREVSWLLHHARGLVSASRLESFGLTTVEAGEAGCPLVLTDIPAHREVAGDHATYVPVGDVDALAAALSSAPERPRMWEWPVSWQDHARVLVDVLVEAASLADPRRGGSR